MIVTLIRHTSVAVAPGICYGQSDVDVAASFAAEADAVRNKLAGRRFDRVYASPLQRCRKLAAHCGHVSPRVDDRLMEMHFGDWEMRAWEAIVDAQLDRWYADWIGEAPSRGESLCALVTRVGTFVGELADGRLGESNESKESNESNQLERVAIFTHAGVIRAFGVVLGLFAVEAAFEFKVEYGDVFDFALRRPAGAAGGFT